MLEKWGGRPFTAVPSKPTVPLEPNPPPPASGSFAHHVNSPDLTAVLPGTVVLPGHPDPPGLHPSHMDEN